MNRMQKCFQASILFIIAFSTNAQDKPFYVDGIVAEIGDQIVLRSDIIFQKQALSQEGKELSDCEMLQENGDKWRQLETKQKN